MSQIEDTENALLALLGDCQLPPEISIDSAPNAWSGNYVRELLSSAPAVRLAFLGRVSIRGPAHDLEPQSDLGAFMSLSAGARRTSLKDAWASMAVTISSPALHPFSIERRLKTRLVSPCRSPK